MGYFEAADLLAMQIIMLNLKGKSSIQLMVVRVVGEVIRKNKMGLYVDYRKAIRIQVPRDLHIGSEEYEEVDVGDKLKLNLNVLNFKLMTLYSCQCYLYY
jgi:hypothetical protein